MKSLLDYKVLAEETFYKCFNILDYIGKNVLTDLDKEAIKATIMEALVTRGEIDPNMQSLDLDNLCIVDDLEHYTYQRHPNISGIPLWMKDKFRCKCISITGGIPISMFLARPPSKNVRYCVYDPNTAVSAIFSDPTFYTAIYNSPTRGIRIKEPRPFVEVNIDGELYLVDVLTKRIMKSSWFKETYDFEIISHQPIAKMDAEQLSYYKDAINEYRGLADILPTFLLFFNSSTSPCLAEMKYEIEQSKIYYPEEWEKYENIKREMAQFNFSVPDFSKRKKPES